MAEVFEITKQPVLQCNGPRKNLSVVIKICRTCKQAFRKLEVGIFPVTIIDVAKPSDPASNHRLLN